jgi:hypothetical protein
VKKGLEVFQFHMVMQEQRNINAITDVGESGERLNLDIVTRINSSTEFSRGNSKIQQVSRVSESKTILNYAIISKR